MIILKILYKFLHRFYHYYQLFGKQIKWRRRNKHNHTSVENIFDFDDITVGKHTYGPLTVMRWGSENEKLVIGNYCSIASGVKFILGGNHKISTLSTYPWEFFFDEGKLAAQSKGPIIIEDDVWIGTDVIILSGLTIGKGSVISAGSVVTKDVPSYSVIGGVPAEVLKKRFTDSVIKKIELIDFSDPDFESSIKTNISLLGENIDEKNIEELISVFGPEKMVLRG